MWHGAREPATYARATESVPERLAPDWYLVLIVVSHGARKERPCSRGCFLIGNTHTLKRVMGPPLRTTSSSFPRNAA